MTAPHAEPNPLARASLLSATVLIGLSAGFFFTYEASVTLGLARVDDVTYVETFQAINATIRNPAFAVVFFGPVPALLLALAANWTTASRTTRGLLIGSVGFYLATMVVTFSGNVPLNQELATYENLTPASAAVARAAFEDAWNRLDLVRTVFVCIGFTAAACAAVTPRRGQNHALDAVTGHTV